MDRFSATPERPRIAAFLSHKYPLADQAGVYDEIESLADSLTAEIRIFHTVHAHPAGVPLLLRDRVGTEFFVPPNPMIYDNDVEFWRSNHPERTGEVLQRLAAAMGLSASAALALPEVRCAFSHARWMAGWQCRLVCAWHLGDPALIGLVASQLLGIPFVLVLHTMEGARHHEELPVFLACAQVVVCGAEDLRARLRRQLGAEAAAKVVAPQDADVLARVGEVLRTAALPSAGREAFRGRPETSLVPAARARPFLILGTERTGSNLLSNLLANQPGVQVAGELFNPRFIRERKLPWILADGVDEARLLRLRARDPLALHLQLVADSERSGGAWVGMKLLYVHGLFDDRVVEALLAQRGMPVIHLVRRDAVRRFVSFCRARESDQWFSPKGKPKSAPKLSPLRIDPQEALSNLVQTEMCDERFSEVFRGHPTMRLSYEELVEDLPGALHRVGAFLGLDVRDVVPQSKKQGERRLADMVANLEELREAFQGTRWASAFAD